MIIGLRLFVICVIYHHTVSSSNEENESCYSSIGCIPVGSPYIDALRPLPLPWSPEKIGTQIYFHRTPDKPWNVTVFPHISLKSVPYDNSLNSYIIIHGVKASGHKKWVQQMKDAILKSRKANVFIIDWGNGADGEIFFLQALSNSLVVGRQAGLLLKEMIQPPYGNGKSHRNLARDAERITMIGHSVGAHSAGHAGKYVSRNLNVKVGCIMALDAAQQWHEFFDPLVRITKNDASKVIAVHTSGKPAALLGFGMMGPYGHIDFYMNGGYHQPGCLLPDLEKMPVIPTVQDVFELAEDEVKEGYMCPHRRAYQYFVESLLHPECTFKGYRVSPNLIEEAISKLEKDGEWSELKEMDPGRRGEGLSLELDMPVDGHEGVYVAYTREAPLFCIADQPTTSHPWYKFWKFPWFSAFGFLH